MIPRLAALSIAEIKAPISPALDGPFESAPFCIVRKRASALRLRSVRFNVWRARLAADLVLAIYRYSRYHNPFSLDFCR
jgi:hypothetical protein